MSSSSPPTHPCRQHSKIHSLRFLIGKHMSFWSEHVRHPHPSEQSKRWLAVTFISPGVQFTIQTLRQTPSLHYSNVVSKTGRTYSPVRLFPPQNCFQYPQVCSSMRCLTEEKLGKGRWGDAFVSLHLLLLLLREAAEAGEHPAGKCRRKTGEYSCQTVAMGAPGSFSSKCQPAISIPWGLMSSKLTAVFSSLFCASGKQAVILWKYQW